ALKKAEVKVTFEKIPGAGHSGREFSTDKMQAAIQEFFDKHLKPKPDAKDKKSAQSKQVPKGSTEGTQFGPEEPGDLRRGRRRVLGPKFSPADPLAILPRGSGVTN